MKKRKRSRSMRNKIPCSTPTPTPTPIHHPTKSRRLQNQNVKRDDVSRRWEALNITPSELSLNLTFPTGQTFTWKQTAPSQFTGVIKSQLISLKHLDHDLAYMLHNHYHHPHHNPHASLSDFLNLHVSLTHLWTHFAASDSRFADLSPYLRGARVLRQDPVECLFQFLCSSNNNISRITKMVDFLSSLGHYLGTVGGFKFYGFPSLQRLSMVSEEQLREAGFGYRAKYVVGAVKALLAKPGGGAQWLASLRDLELHEVVDALCTLPGVGPKVAACIALFSLDQHHAIPVDTHVWKIATRYLMPELAGAHLTPKLCTRVAETFVSKFGKYAGWAQTLLFISELPSQKALLPLHFQSVEETKSAQRKQGKQQVSAQVLHMEVL